MCLHRDYFDLGAMLYEQLPLIGPWCAPSRGGWAHERRQGADHRCHLGHRFSAGTRLSARRLAGVGCGRDGERLLALGRHGITPLQFDGRDASAVSEAAAGLPRVDLVILNAGNCEYMDVAEGLTVPCLLGSSRPTWLPPAMPWPPFTAARGGWTPCHRQLVGELVAAAQAEAYGASKAALDYLADTLRLDLAGKGSA